MEFELDTREKKELARWKENINRGLIDVFMLSFLMDSPAYGNSFITNTRDSMEFQASTIYPKLKDYEDSNLVKQVKDEKRKQILASKSYPVQGPGKKFYELTFPGA